MNLVIYMQGANLPSGKNSDMLKITRVSTVNYLKIKSMAGTENTTLLKGTSIASTWTHWRLERISPVILHWDIKTDIFKNRQEVLYYRWLSTISLRGSIPISISYLRFQLLAFTTQVFLRYDHSLFLSKTLKKNLSSPSISSDGLSASVGSSLSWSPGSRRVQSSSY